ncbi:hypothetical protein [Candidatus Pristimantibacillus sp. PTI5]|uniref:hypothetical protein n=1 Tax=Candidatus Pristimantibacillus sp. PTI5 TaxID=3400422 RepID=UPI003B01F286
MTEIDAFIDILESSGTELQVDELCKINSLISGMSTSQQLGLSGELTPKANSRLYHAMNRIVLIPAAKEHVAFSYFAGRIEQELELGDSLLEELLQALAATGYLALVSLVITVIKRDRLSLMQLEKAEKIIDEKTFMKEATAFRYREAVKAGFILNSEDVLRLLSMRAYSTLDYILESKAATKEGLGVFSEPQLGEKDRKIKRGLYEKASQVLSESSRADS